MTTAIIGVGNVGGALARHLVRAGEPVVLAARDESATAALAGELGSLASAAGDLHQGGGLGGKLLDVDQARAAVAAA
jgi:predicted dinucleotide-binding enzyme